MIARFAFFLLLLYALGFILFAVTLAKPAGALARPAEGVVVLTGGPGRIEHAVDVLEDGGGKRLLVAGADPSVTKSDIARRLGGNERLLRCCVDLGSESVDTRSNAEEAERWVQRNRFRSVRLITSDWHMRRAEYEFARVMGGEVEVHPDAVRSEPSLLTLFAEYNKLVLRRISVWIDI